MEQFKPNGAKIPNICQHFGVSCLDLRGFMAMGPALRDPRPPFAELRRLRDEAQQRLGIALPILSMGMSDDLEAAVAEGTTMLRIGRALFGERR